MSQRPYRIMLVEPESPLLELLVDAIIRRLDAVVTCAVTTDQCLDNELHDPHDLVIAELQAPSCGGLLLAQRLRSLGNRPVILLADEITQEETAAAMRLGVRDVLVKPFPVEDLLDSAETVLREYVTQVRRAARHRRLRDTVRRVIQERRELNHRIDLLCRDLVGSHRRLVNRVAEIEADVLQKSK